MRITLHAGHNPAGKIACGASDYLDESTEARKLITRFLKKDKSRITDTTVNNGTSQLDVLKKIVKKCNMADRDIDVSIHFNSWKHTQKDGKRKGTEVWLYGTTVQSLEGKKHYIMAQRILKNMEKLGFKNRGIKVTKDFYFLKKTTKPAMLIEVCFVDDEDDAILYKKSIDNVVEAIYKGIFM